MQENIKSQLGVLTDFSNSILIQFFCDELVWAVVIPNQTPRGFHARCFGRCEHHTHSDNLFIRQKSVNNQRHRLVSFG